MKYRTLLITGGTGTFGNAFANRVLQENLAERVIILSRDEKKQLDMEHRFNDSRLRFYLGDVRDLERLERAFRGVQIVIHAASLKQIHRSGEAADEFFKTICIGAVNVINAAHRTGVERVVALSTDKAVEACVPYGAFKAVSEWLFIGANAWGDAKFACCRYGNILGSRGSVLELWRRQFERTGKIEVTDLRMTRFWLPIRDAVDLVLVAAERMRGGEIFIPKKVYRSSVVELAMKHFPNAPLVTVGKRSYEKVHEVLVAKEEVDRCHDCGHVYVLRPLHIRWTPGPYGANCPKVPEDFQYRSDRW